VDGYPTPEDAARSTAPDRSFPGLPVVEEWAFVIGSSVSPDGRRAFVLLGEDRPVDAYWGQESWCQRENDGWHLIEWNRDGGAGLTGKPLGIDPELHLGLIALAVPAPAHATGAAVRYDGQDHLVDVTKEGWVFFAAWEHPYHEDQMGDDWYSRLRAAPEIVTFT
jgi:hypothetical protein